MKFYPGNRVLSCALAIGAAIVASTPSFATNGYFLIGYGAKSRSMGGVGVAYGQDGLAAAANPAAMSDVDVDTMRFDIGGEIFIPKRGFVNDSSTLESGFSGSDGPVQHQSDSNLFLIPSMGGVYKFNRKLTLGMAVIGNGANTRYDQQVPGKPSCMDGNTTDSSGATVTGSTVYNFNCLGSRTAGASLLQMEVLPSVSYKVTKTQSIGASLTLAIQQFRAYGLQAFGSDGLGYTGGDGSFTNEGNDYSYGAGVHLGWLGKFFDGRLSIGANYASRTHMTKFNKYENLFAEHGSFDIPENFALGLAFKATKKLTIAADFERIKYGDIKSIANPGPNAKDPINFFPPGCQTLSDGSNTCELGQDDGMGFGWQDQNVYKIGVNYDYNDQWSFRVGYNYAKAPIPKNQVLFNFLAPAVTEHHATLGLSYRPSKNVEWSANYMHAFKNTIKGPTALGPTAGLPVNGENASIDMYINSFGVSFGYKM
jgi:long-chain fatty acid transport protein